MNEDDELIIDILSAPHTSNYFERHRQLNKKVWMKKDRSIVNIADMDTEHIINSLRMLTLINQQYTRAYRGLVAELNARTVDK